MSNLPVKKALILREISVFGAALFSMLTQVVIVTMLATTQYVLYVNELAKEPDLIILVICIPVAWLTGALGAVIYNLIAKLFGGLRMNVSLMDDETD